MQLCGRAAIVCVLTTAAAVVGRCETTPPTDALTPIAELRQRSIAEMQARPPVRIRGVVTWQAKRGMLIVQDQTSAIFCYVPEDTAADGPIEGRLDADLVPGTEVEIEGQGEWGGFGPRVRITQARPTRRRSGAGRPGGA
jgi:hypothetical protein